MIISIDSESHENQGRNNFAMTYDKTSSSFQLNGKRLKVTLYLTECVCTNIQDDQMIMLNFRTDMDCPADKSKNIRLSQSSETI